MAVNYTQEYISELANFTKEYWRKFDHLYERQDGKFTRARIIKYDHNYGRYVIETENAVKFETSLTHKVTKNRFDRPDHHYHIIPKNSVVHQLYLYDNNIARSSKQNTNQTKSQVKENSMTCKTEKILATLLMEKQEYVTVNCSFNSSGKTYAYVCSNEFAKTLSEGDQVVVPNGKVHSNLTSFLKAKHKDVSVAIVVSIDKELDIDPDESCINYKPILQVLNLNEAVEFSDLHNENSAKVKRSLRKKKIEKLLKDFE